MIQIDWSKAPEGATHWGHDTHNTVDGFFYRDIQPRSYKVWHSAHGIWRSAYGRPAMPTFIARPTTLQWDGTYLPPIGTVCEVDHEGAWYETTIVGYDPDDGAVIFKTHERCEVPYDGYTTPGRFRPIRTPEQIAAEEREAAIDDMWRVYWQPDVHTAKEALGLLYDAGYRKQSN